MSQKPVIVFLSTFPPRQCGIATYTKNLITALESRYSISMDAKVIAMTRKQGVHYRFEKKVIGRIAHFHREEYARMAHRLNQLAHVKLVHIQHEYGIFGGTHGEYVLDFIRALKKPVIITFHTVLPKPEEGLRAITAELIERAQGLHVMTEQAKAKLIALYGVDAEKISVVPHGIPSLQFKASTEAKTQLKLGRRTVLLTFGLLSRNKGIEYVIQSLPKVVKKYPDVLYVVAGATHPVVLQEEGEVYRNSLKALVKELHLEKHVRFINRFLTDDELSQFLYATDVYVATPLDPNQAVSGTLSYALGSGRPVVSTAFAQAQEVLTSDLGYLVEFRRPEEYTDVFMRLLKDRGRLVQMGLRAYQWAHKTRWSNVAISTVRMYGLFAKEFKYPLLNLPPVRLDTLTRLTDDIGIMQFSRLRVPEPASGYTTDDNARALVAATHYFSIYKQKAALPLIQTYLDFLRFAAQPGEGFYNYVDGGRLATKQNAKEDLEDSVMRAFQALAYVASKKNLPSDFHRQAMDLFLAYFNAYPIIRNLRSKAFFLKGLYSIWKADIGLPFLEERVQECCAVFLESYHLHAKKDWEWFEPTLTYANSILPEALFIGWKITGNNQYRVIAERTLKFLLEQTMTDEYYIPIGQDGWYPYQGTRAYFDQQPEEPAYMVQSLYTIYKLTKNERYRELSQKVFSWFLGNNQIAHTMYDEATGGCFDGLQETSVNLNEGAESAISYFLARLCMEEQGNKKRA